jgi:hypothetical protein
MSTSRRPCVFLCGTPSEQCTGSLAKLNHALEGRGLRAHTSSASAFDCQRRYLIHVGYTQLDGTSFAAPNEGPILVLTKKSRYGGKLRNGKEGTRNQPLGKHGGFIFLL